MEKINSRNVKVLCDCGEDTIWRLKTPQEMRDDALEEYANHDCHLSSEDGCEVCEKYYGQI
jgi:hypothetical protein